ncbi:uncharacterized protein LOC122522502 [Polistes fuscatus]|uniref:uncharacterized protein LOC122522502 n=1 Tax=Polistes fuscatus TaxID=30207 RepID=UPI001CA8E30F|nr:uncharacterized protein LOC122522502 [Polistes fuscatus]
MKLTLFTLLALCLIATCRSTEEEYDYEEESAAAVVTPAPTKPAAPAPRLGGLLSSRGRVNVGGRKATPTQSTTPKPVEQQPLEEEEEAEEPLEDIHEQEEVLTTTTESLKKVRGGVRPFRSNEELIAALKRRRAQTGPISHSKESSGTQAAQTESTTPKSRTSSSSRNKANGNSGGESRTTATSRGRFGSSRGKPVQEEVEETQQEEVQVKPKPYRRG